MVSNLVALFAHDSLICRFSQYLTPFSFIKNILFKYIYNPYHYFDYMCFLSLVDMLRDTRFGWARYIITHKYCILDPYI